MMKMQIVSDLQIEGFDWGSYIRRSGCLMEVVAGGEKQEQGHRTEMDRAGERTLTESDFSLFSIFSTATSLLSSILSSAGGRLPLRDPSGVSFEREEAMVCVNYV